MSRATGCSLERSADPSTTLQANSTALPVYATQAQDEDESPDFTWRDS